MNDTVVVTLRAENFEKDFELPVQVPLSELYPRLTLVLQNINAKKFGDYPGVLLKNNGGALLREDATLADYGIVTGLILDVEKNKKVGTPRWIREK